MGEVARWIKPSRKRRRHRARDIGVDRVRPIGGEAGRIEIRRSEEHTSELQSLMRISYAVFCLKKKTKLNTENTPRNTHTSILITIYTHLIQRNQHNISTHLISTH